MWLFSFFSRKRKIKEKSHKVCNNTALPRKRDLASVFWRKNEKSPCGRGTNKIRGRRKAERPT